MDSIFLKNDFRIEIIFQPFDIKDINVFHFR